MVNFEKNISVLDWWNHHYNRISLGKLDRMIRYIELILNVNAGFWDDGDINKSSFTRNLCMIVT